MASEGRDNRSAPPTSHEPTHADSIHLDHVLASCHENLKKLKATTLESVPPYNHRIRTKTHPELLRQRLLPIGQFIVAYLERTPEQGRRRLELLLCRRIAAEYWPLPVDKFTHLRIHEMYRNALFHVASQGANAVTLPGQRAGNDAQPSPDETQSQIDPRSQQSDTAPGSDSQPPPDEPHSHVDPGSRSPNTAPGSDSQSPFKFPTDDEVTELLRASENSSE
jgi:hypothetical protein